MNTQTKDTYCINCGGRYINNICSQCGRQNISAINAESQNNNFVSSQQTQASGLNYNNQIQNNNLEHNQNDDTSQQSQSDNILDAQMQDDLTNTAVKQKAFNTVSKICISIAAVLTIVTALLYSDLPYLKKEHSDIVNKYTSSQNDLEMLTISADENNATIAGLNKKIAENQAIITELSKGSASYVEYLKKTVESSENTIDELRTNDMLFYEYCMFFIFESDTTYYHRIYCTKMAGQKPSDVVHSPRAYRSSYTKCPNCVP